MTLKVIRKRLWEREGAPPDTRYNPDTDTFETSVDGGTTWTENPGADPRVNPAYQMPPNTDPDVRCAAAAGMVEDVRKVINAAITGGGVVGIGNIIIAFLILPLGWVYLLIVAVAAALAGTTSFAWNAAFTEEVYEALLCLFYDHLDADGHIDQAGWDALLAQAYIDFADPNVGGGLELVFKLHGVVGLNNAGSAYADPDADCSACQEKWCRMYDFRIDLYQFAIEGVGTWVEGVGVTADFVQDGDNTIRYCVLRTDDMETTITDMEFGFSYTKGGVTGGGGNTAIGVFNVGFSQTFFNYLLDAIPPVPDSPLFWEDDAGGEGITSLFLQLITGILVDTTDDPGGSGTIVYLKLCGVGEPPAGGVECDPETCGE